jgi:TolB protein
MIGLVLILGMIEVHVAVSENGRFASTNTDNTVFLPVLFKNYPPPEQPYLLKNIDLPDGSHPHGIALDLAGQRAFVGTHLGNTLIVIDTDTHTIIGSVDLPGADGPNGVAYHAPTDRVYVANRNSSNVSIVDPTNLQVVKTIDVGALPDGVVAQDNWIYVANWGSNSVSVIDAMTHTVSNTLTVGLQPAMLVGNDSRGFVYLSGYGSNAVYYLKDGQTFNSRPGVASPYGLAFDPITFRLYAASRGMNRVTMVDVNPNWVVGDIDTSAEVFVVGINPRTGHLFAVLGDQVKVFDRRDNALLTAFPIGDGSEEGIVVDAARGLVYVTAGDSDQLVVIQDSPAYDIAYVSWLQNVSTIHITEDKGEHSRILAGPDIAFVHPDWDPAGKHLAFSALTYARNEYDIWRMEAGGQNLINLTTTLNGTRDERPLWSPDGSQIGWLRDDALWTMDEYGQNRARRTPVGMVVHDLAWSPDGQWLAVAAQELGTDDIYLVAPDGPVNVINLTDHAAVDSQPEWAPSSTAIAFTSDRNGNSDIYLLDITDLDNVHTLPLTADPANDHSPAFSPDGNQIAFMSHQDGCNSPCVFVMAANGSGALNLTGETNFLTPLRWSPDGRYLATHTLGGTVSSQIVKVDTHTGQVIMLTDNAGTNLWPVWRPDTWK